MRRPKPLVRPSTNHGKPCWLADLPPSLTGKGRVRRFFDTRQDADAFVRAYDTDARTFGQSSSFLLHLDPYERNEVFHGLEKLRRLGWTLADAVRLVEESGKSAPSLPLSVLVDQFLAEKASINCRPRYLAKLGNTMELFLAGRREVSTGNVSAADIREFLNRNGWKSATRKSYLIDLRALFNFAVRQKFIRDNPAMAVEMPILDDKPPGILPVSDWQRLLETCQRTDPGLLTFVSLSLFGGLRTEEALRISNDDLRKDSVEIKGHKAKTRKRRLVAITPQLRAWLDAGLSNGGTFPPLNWQRRWKAVRQRAGLFRGYPHNAARHSFVSFHLAKYQDAAQTAYLAGHSEQMLFGHYRELVETADAETFFGLLPDPSALAEGLARRKADREAGRLQRLAALRRRCAESGKAPAAENGHSLLESFQSKSMLTGRDECDDIQ
jgi:integrase